MAKKTRKLQFPPPPASHLTYAVFTVARRRSPTGSSIVIRVVGSARDIAALDIPRHASTFYFCDAPAKENSPQGDVLRGETNLSPPVFIATEVISADEMRKRLLAQGVLKSLKPIRAIRNKSGKLSADVVRHAVWLSKTNSAPWHAIGRSGEYMPVRAGRNITVIDQHKNILMGPHDAVPRLAHTPVTIPHPKDRRFKL